MSDEVTTIDNLENAIAKLIVEYNDKVKGSMNDVILEVADSAVEELQASSPKDTGAYAKSWKRSKAYDTADIAKVVVFNKGHGQITHLLEKGHAKQNGGRVAAIPHIKTAAENAEEMFELAIKEVI